MIDFNNYIREMCTADLLAHPMSIGGSNTTVEIDESQFSRRKNNRDSGFPAQWVFGGICRETGERFTYAVADQNAATLLPISQVSVLPSATVVSDLWRAYNTVSNHGYQQLTVNHSLNFVDPVTGAHTQNIECSWKNAKQRNKRHHGTHRSMLDSYLCEWMWRQRHKTLPCLFDKMSDDIARLLASKINM